MFLLGIFLQYMKLKIQVVYSLTMTNQLTVKLNVSSETASNISSQKEFSDCVLFVHNLFGIFWCKNYRCNS